MIQLDTNKIEETLSAAIEQVVNEVVRDPNWMERVRTAMAREMRAQVTAQLGLIDLPAAIQEATHSWLADRDSRRTPGLNDLTNSTTVVLYDEKTVVANPLEAVSLAVDKDAIVGGNLEVRGDLVFRGAINTDNLSWSRFISEASGAAAQQLTSSLLPQLVSAELDNRRSLAINAEQLEINGSPLVVAGDLNPAISSSSLTSVGTLSDLEVAGSCEVTGPTLLAQTLVIANGRVGINTEYPGRALSVTEEETTVSIGKLQSNTSWVGTEHLTDLVIGTNRTPAISIRAHDNSVDVARLRVSGHSVSWSDATPGTPGQAGDIVFSTRPGTTWAWICMGGARWKALNQQ